MERGHRLRVQEPRSEPGLSNLLPSGMHFIPVAIGVKVHPKIQLGVQWPLCSSLGAHCGPGLTHPVLPTECGRLR